MYIQDLIPVGYCLCCVIHIIHQLDFQQKRVVLDLNDNGNFLSPMFTIEIDML